jgi:hypothetical protein
MELKLNLFILDYNLILIYKLYMQSTKRLKVQTTGLRSPKLSPIYLHITLALWNNETGLQTLTKLQHKITTRDQWVPNHPYTFQS